MNTQTQTYTSANTYGKTDEYTNTFKGESLKRQHQRNNKQQQMNATNRIPLVIHTRTLT